MKRLVIAIAALAGTVPAAAPAQRGPARGYANPSAVIAAELSLGRDAAARGQWTALAASGAPDAVLFAPRLIWAQPWLKGRTNPPAAERWAPYQVWSSCDGSLVASRGAWTGAGGKGGWYARLWQRQPNGAYKWLLSEAGPLAQPLPEPEMIAADVADCPQTALRRDEGEPRGKQPKPAKPPKITDLPPPDPLHRAGAAGDRSLTWDTRLDPDGTRHLVVTWRKDGRELAVIDERVTPASQ